MFGRLFEKWAVGRQRKEMNHFVEGLRAADSDDIGLIVACATDWRHKYEEEGFNLLFPSLYIATDPMFAFKMTKRIQALQRDGLPHLAVGLMVWLHSFRALTRPELRGLGRSMWKELQRGFECAEVVAFRTETNFGIRFNAYDCDNFPDGLTSEPR